MSFQNALQQGDPFRGGNIRKTDQSAMYARAMEDQLQKVLVQSHKDSLLLHRAFQQL